MARKPPATLNGVAALAKLRQDAEAGQAPDDEAFRTRYPALYSILAHNRITETQWTDPARLTITNANGEWSVQVMVPGLAAYRSALGPTIDQAFSDLELKLNTDPAGWQFNLKRRARVRKVEDLKIDS